MKYLILILVMILFDNCEQSTNAESKWKIWETETLKHNQLGFDDIVVLSPKGALLFGDEDTPENFQQMQEQKNLYLTRFAVIYKTKDGGKTWHEEKLPKPQYFNPVDFIQTEKGIFGMAYSGSGRVQVRK